MYKNYINKPDILNRYVYKILLIMRLTTVILIISMLQVSASTLAQKFTYVKKQVPLSQVFKEVKKQTGYNILWNERSMNANQLIDANFRKSSIQEVLNQCIGQLPLSFSIDGKMVFIKQKENEPSLVDKVMDLFKLIDVRGKVVDEKNEPLVGAVVRVKGTKIATSTNSKGEFTLANVDDKAVLVISFLGYEPQEITVTEKMGEVRLVMSIDGLKEVEINAGYYTVKDRERTGNITKITDETIEKQPVLNPLQALQNRVPGMQITQVSGIPGNTFNVQIRGRSSLNNSVGNKPLYIIDDIIYPSSSLSSSYQTGIFPSGIDPLSTINPNDIESIEVLKDADATAIYGSRGANGVVLIRTKKGKSGPIKINAGLDQGFSKVAKKLDLLNTEEYIAMRLEALKNDGLTVGSTDYDINGTWDDRKYTDWQEKLIGGTANTSIASLNVTGGGDNLTYLLSGNYYKEGTVFPGDFNFNRLGIRSGLNLGSGKNKFTLSFTGTYNHTQNNLVRNDPTSNILLAPNYPDPYDQYGQLNWEKNTVFINPMAELLRKNNISTDTFIANMLMNYKILQNLVFKTSVSYNLLRTDEFLKTPLASYSPANNLTSTSRKSSLSNSSINSWSVEPQLGYNAKLGPGNLEALLGLSFQESISELRGLDGTNFSSDELMDNILAAGTVTPVYADYSQYRYSAIFARLNYNLVNKYFINLTARRDGSSRFGKDRQFANFGAIGAAWVFSEEKFFKDLLPFVSLGKFRVSYGITGNDQIGDYKYLSLWRSVGNYQGVATLTPSLGNAEYSWETNKKGELALQLGFLNSKLNIEIAYYNNRSSNQLIGDPLPPSTGNSTIIANRPATVQNTGLELISDFKIINKNNWKWFSGFNLTIPRNKLISYPDIENSSDASNYVVGQPLSIQFIYNVRGVNPKTGLYDIEDKDGNGVINTADRYLYKFIGQRCYGGFQNSITFKSVTLDFLISFTKQNGNNYLYSSNTLPGRWSSNVYPNSNQLSIVLDRWQKIDDVASTQKFSTTAASATIYNNARNNGMSIEDASYARLKNISLSYSLPKEWLSKINLSNATFSLRGQNILTLTNYKGSDPETQGLTRLPPLRTFVVGLNITL